VLEHQVYVLGARFLEHGRVDPEAARYGLVALEAK
jgi:hypothetical protein